MATERQRGGGAAAAAAASYPFAAARRASRTVDPLAAFVGALRFEVEHRRLFPWIAVAFGAGIGLAFAADGPLALWPPLVGAAMSGAAAYAARARLAISATLVGATALFLGFAAAVHRIDAVGAPVLGRTAIGPIEGFVESIEERRAGGRVVLLLAKLGGVEGSAMPRRARVGVRSLEGVRPGDYVAGTARLLPPPEAARPGGYDFARDAYFRGIGAVGSVSGRLRTIDPPPAPRPPGLDASALIDRARNALTARIASAIGGQAGAVAAALITGKRGLIEEATNDVLRAAGIYHVVSISGLHMMLAAGTFFWLTRGLLALSPSFSQRWPIKKIAALVGMAGAAVYCVFSGSDVAAERSLCMILVMQGAILFDRPALSMRNLALSALVVLAREPEALLGPSFQMSFGAVAGLIALAEWSRSRRPDVEGADPLKRAAIWLGLVVAGTIATTLVATVATAPFASFHFQNLQPYGLLGNAATLPLVSFVVMPCAVLGTLAFPFGLDRPVWWVMGQGVEAVLKLSEWVAGLGGSVVVVPAFGNGALALLAAALLCATLFLSGLRWSAFLPAGLGLLAAWSAPRPDLYVARDGAGAAVRGADGRLVMLGRPGAFTTEQWLKADGDARRASDPTLNAGTRCDRIGCTAALPDGRHVSWLDDRRGFAEDCRRAAIVVSRLSAPEGCRAALVIDRAFLARHGATALTIAGGRLEVTGTRRAEETRPWLARAQLAPTRAPSRRADPAPADPTPLGGGDDPPLPPAEPPDGMTPP